MRAPLTSISVGVIAERRKAKSPWIDFVWRPISVLPGVPQTQPWTMLDGNAEVAMFYVGSAGVALYRSETARYRENLLSGAPAIWVVMRLTGTEPPYELVTVTADPSEGEALTQTGTDLVESVPMPHALQELIETFVAEHHVEQEFYKRERNRADPEALARREPPVKGRKDG
jgi:hypothetical protein